MRFTKMQGAGNDFIVINNIKEKIPHEELPELARELCTRRMSVGADGLMAAEAAQQGGDFRMLFFNADGSMGEMCGNGARCIARFGYEEGLAGEEMVIETTAGPVSAQRLSENRYRVRLNDVTAMELNRKLTVDVNDVLTEWDCAYVELGNPGIPHLAVEYRDLEKTEPKDLWALGSALRHHKSLPKGANVNFYEILEDGRIFERTFERGVEDFTYACGTGTGSVAAVLTQQGRVPLENGAAVSGSDSEEKSGCSADHADCAVPDAAVRWASEAVTPVVIDMAGGRLEIEAVRSGDGSITDLFLIGPAEAVFKGERQVTK